MTGIETILTTNLDIWTSAIERKNGAGRGRSKKVNFHGIEKLRALILDLAVRGKLVPQDPNNEPAQELVKMIRDRRLEKSNRSNGRNEHHPVTDTPYQVPKSWVWSHLSDLVDLENGDRGKNYPNKSTLVANGIPFVNAGNLKDGLVDQSEMTFISPSHFERLSGGKIREGDILFCLRGSLGKTAIVRGFEEGAIASSLVIVRNHSWFDVDYLRLYFDSPLCSRLIKRFDNGTAQPNLSSKSLGKFLLPIPPLSEQHRIVAKVDELMALCDTLEAETSGAVEAHQVLVEQLLATLTNSQDAKELARNWARIEEHFDILFTTEDSVDQLKQTILQLAVMGKLVPQDPKDEPASELLKRIKAEKANLVRSGDLRKEKFFGAIDLSEVPFQIPANWSWARIGELALFTEYGTSRKGDVESDGVPVLAMGNIFGGQVVLESRKTIPEDSEEIPELYLKHNDILYNRTNSYELVGKTGIYKGEDDRFTFASYLIRIRLSVQKCLPDFINLTMNSPYFRETQIIPKITKQTGQANVNGTSMRNMLVPVPPYSEQQRIIKKLDQIFTTLDGLKSQLAHAREQRAQFADAVVSAAVT